LNCVLCGGKIEIKKVTFVYDYDDNYFLIENVPAEVCIQCGEKTYDPEVTDVLLHVSKKSITPSKTIEIPVFDYSSQTVS